MKLVNKIELVLENFDKCSAVLHADCPLGQLFDFSCALKSFVVQKMQELEKPAEEKKPEEQV